MPIVSKLFIEVNLSFHMRSDSLIAMIVTPSPGAFLVKGKYIALNSSNCARKRLLEFHWKMRRGSIILIGLFLPCGSAIATFYGIFV